MAGWDWGTVVAIVATLSGIVISVVNGRSAIAAQRLTATTTREVAAGQQAAARDETAGELALKIAQRSEARLNVLEDFYADAGDWYDRHSARDHQVERELTKLDPTFQVPPAEPFPRLRRTEPARA